MKITLRYKVAILVLVASLLCAAAIGTFTFVSAKRHMHQMVDAEYMGKVKMLTHEIEVYLNHILHDLMFLANTPPVQDIFRALAGGGYDADGKSTYEMWVRMLGAIFKEFANAQRHYMQMRLLDASGMELVRVDFDGRDARILKDNELQDKSDRYYFVEGMKRGPGETYISRIDLNQENGKIEIPYKPTVRFAMPIFDEKGGGCGLLVLNVLADSFLRLLPFVSGEDHGNIFITDQDGFYLRHSKDPSKEWGSPYDLGTGKSLVKDYPDMAPKILAGNKGVAYKGKVEIFYSSVEILNQLRLTIGLEMPRAIVEAPLHRFKILLVSVIFGILAMTWIFSLVFSRGILNPIQTLKKATERISKGDLTTRVEIDSGDEIEELADHFNRMTRTLKKRTDRLTKLYELGIVTGKTPLGIADRLVSIIASAIGVKMATIARMEKDTLQIASFYNDGKLIHEGSFSLEGTPCGEVKEEKKPIQYQNVMDHFPEDLFFRHYNVQSYLGVPIITAHGHVVGVIDVMDDKPKTFSMEDIELLFTLSRRIAFEWEAESHIRQIQFTSMKLEALYRIASSLSHSLFLDDLLNNTLDIILGIGFLNLEHEAMLFLVDHESQDLLLRAYRGFSEEMAAYDQRFKIGECLCGQVAGTGEILFSPNSEKNPSHSRCLPLCHAHGDIVIPLKSREKILGVLCLHKEVDSPFSEDDKNIFEAIGNQFGMAIENVTLFQQIRDYNIELEKKIDERTEEIQSINMELIRASKAKSDFLAGMSHELRTPLNAIIGFSEVLQEEYFGALNEKQAEYMNDILTSGRHLLSLINDILDLSKIEAGKIEINLSPVKIKELLENSLIMIREKALKHGITLEVQIPEEIRDLEIPADERILKQILFNLLSNAAKFTPDGGKIRVNAQSTIFDSQSSIEISVADTGIGIALENQEKIFEDFFQVSWGLTGKTPGTGLGLPLARRLVKLHGGHIWVESGGEGKGSRFTFVLPLEPVIPSEEGISSMETGIATDEIFINHLTRIISISERYNKIFSLCGFTAPGEELSKRVEEIRKALRQGKRAYDFLGMDAEGNLYLILQETDREGAKIVCDRFKTFLTSAFALKNVDYAIATFPQDGKIGEGLIKIAGQKGEE